MVGIVTSVLVYGALLIFASDIAFLNRMAITLGIVLVTGLALTILRPMAQPVVMPVNDQISLESSSGAKWVGVGVVLAAIALYVVFW